MKRLSKATQTLLKPLHSVMTACYLIKHLGVVWFKIWNGKEMDTNRGGGMVTKMVTFIECLVQAKEWK